MTHSDLRDTTRRRSVEDWTANKSRCVSPTSLMRNRVGPYFNAYAEEQSWPLPAGSLAAFMTLLMQNHLVDPKSSAEMRDLLQQPLWVSRSFVGFKEGLEQLANQGSLTTLLSKGGVRDGHDDCAVIAREIDTGKDKEVVTYIAVGLRFPLIADMKALILELDKCVLANNNFTLVQGGHGQHELEEEQGEPPERVPYNHESETRQELELPPQRQPYDQETETEVAAEAPSTDEG